MPRRGHSRLLRGAKIDAEAGAGGREREEAGAARVESFLKEEKSAGIHAEIAGIRTCAWTDARGADSQTSAHAHTDFMSQAPAETQPRRRIVAGIYTSEI